MLFKHWFGSVLWIFFSLQTMWNQSLYSLVWRSCGQQKCRHNRNTSHIWKGLWETRKFHWFKRSQIQVQKKKTMKIGVYVEFYLNFVFKSFVLCNSKWVGAPPGEEKSSPWKIMRWPGDFWQEFVIILDILDILYCFFTVQQQFKTLNSVIICTEMWWRKWNLIHLLWNANVFNHHKSLNRSYPH